MYVMLCSRSDISFVVSLVSRFQSNPREVYWLVVKRILRYIKGTKDYNLTCDNKGKNSKVIRYSDVDFSGVEKKKNKQSYVVKVP
jgi:hypothetical protein